MRHYRQGRSGSVYTMRERTDCPVHWQVEGRVKLGRPRCGTANWTEWQLLDEQQARENSTAEIGGDQVDCGRGKRGYHGTAAFR
eukprot:4649381-Heterocapsa_arctica.AAC.1